MAPGSCPGPSSPSSASASSSSFPLPVPDSFSNVTTYAYHPLRDWLTEVHHPDGSVPRYEHDIAGRQVAVIDPLNRRTEFDHDALGRVTLQRRFLDGRSLERHFEFDGNGNRTKAIDEVGRETNFEFDELNRLTATVQPSPDGVAPRPVTRRQYDAGGNLTRYVNANGSSWAYQHDALGRVVGETDPLGHVTAYEHDIVGNVVKKTDPKGQVTTLQYDALNRLTRVDYADGEWATVAYDAGDNRTQIAGSGGVTLQQTFDELDRVRTIANGALQRNLEYTYTPNGNRQSFSVANTIDGTQQVTTYEWDEMNRVSRILPWTGDVISYGYGLDGRRGEVELPNGLHLSHSYDDLGRLIEMNYTHPMTGNVAFFRYTLDDAGNRATMTDSEGLTNYQYDNLDRLIQAAYPDGTWERFAMDAVGNRLRHEDAEGVTDYVLDAGDRLLSTTGAKPATHAWDENGNMVSRSDVQGTTRYVWNARDRLARVELAGGGTNEYRYYPLSDMRVSLTDRMGVEQRFVLDGPNVAQELDAFNATSAAYIEGVGIDEHLARMVPGMKFAYLSDAISSVRRTIGEQGERLNEYAYTAYGANRQMNEVASNPYRYTGRYAFDANEYDYRSRCYLPQLARFLAVDPLSPLESTYNYVNSRPTISTDPLGLRLFVAGYDKELQQIKALLRHCLSKGEAIQYALRTQAVTNPDIAFFASLEQEILEITGNPSLSGAQLSGLVAASSVYYIIAVNEDGATTPLPENILMDTKAYGGGVFSRADPNLLRIYFNVDPKACPEPVDVTMPDGSVMKEFPPSYIRLSHEIGHAYDYERGSRYTAGDDWKGENYAIETENALREDRGFLLRVLKKK